ncbi:MAG: hypothetical protein IKO10_16825 [Lachnospiraceae bacterium]|nr:hypothetical protein [Lachnospiraceae bacterium]
MDIRNIITTIFLVISLTLFGCACMSVLKIEKTRKNRDLTQKEYRYRNTSAVLGVLGGILVLIAFIIDFIIG